MKINKFAIIAFACMLAFFGGAAYKFATTGVTMSPFMLLGLGCCMLSLGVICSLQQEKSNRGRKNGSSRNKRIR